VRLAVAALAPVDFFTPGMSFDTSAVLDASTLAVHGVVDISATNGVTVTAEGGDTTCHCEERSDEAISCPRDTE
jgi:hypothetical protein